MRQLLRESKHTSAVSQEMLSDPAGAKLIADYRAVLDKAIKLGRIDVAKKAAASIENLLARESDLARAEEVSGRAQNQMARTIIDELDRDTGN